MLIWEVLLNKNITEINTPRCIYTLVNRKTKNPEFMINYRVQNIDGLVLKLKNNGVTIVDDIETFDYGKFVHIMDAEGIKIELWEPIDSVFTAMGGKTTK